MHCRAVVTAGGRIDDAFAAVTGTTVKALVPFGAGALIDVVLDALGGAGIADLAVVGGAEVAHHLGSGIRMLDAAVDGSVNVLRALDAWGEGDLLFATSDLPFVDASALGSFLAASRAFDLTMPLADGSAYESAFPGAPDHVTSLRGERVANGSVFFIGARARAPLRRIAASFFEARKSRIAMARLLGPALMLRFLLRRLRIADVESRAGRVLRVRTAAVRDASPNLCYDIDSLADYTYACAPR